MDDDAWNHVIDAMKDVFGTDKLEITETYIEYRRNEDVYLLVQRAHTDPETGQDHPSAVEGAMALHHVVLEDITGIEPDKEVITFHTADGVYTYHRPY